MRHTRTERERDTTLLWPVCSKCRNSAHTASNGSINDKRKLGVFWPMRRLRIRGADDLEKVEEGSGGENSEILVRRVLVLRVVLVLPLANHLSSCSLCEKRQRGGDGATLLCVVRLFSLSPQPLLRRKVPLQLQLRSANLIGAQAAEAAAHTSSPRPQPSKSFRRCDPRKLAAEQQAPPARTNGMAAATAAAAAAAAAQFAMFSAAVRRRRRPASRLAPMIDGHSPQGGRPQT